MISNASSTLNSTTTKGTRRSARARQMRSGRSTPNIDVFRPSAYNTPISLTPLSQFSELLPEAKREPKPSKTRTNTRKRKLEQATDASAGSTPVAKRPRRHPSQRHKQRSSKGAQGSHDPPKFSRASSRYKRYKAGAASSSTTSETPSASQILGSSPSLQAKEILRRARETLRLQVDLTSREATTSNNHNRKPFLMDVILNAQEPNLANLEDLLTEALERNFGRPFYTGDVHGHGATFDIDYSDFSHEAPYVWQGVTVESWDLSPRKIYHVSAERSTATWNPTLDGELGRVSSEGLNGCEQE